MAYDSDQQKIVIVYTNSYNARGEAIVGSVSSNSISYGSSVTFTSSNVLASTTSYDVAAGKYQFRMRQVHMATTKLAQSVVHLLLLILQRKLKPHMVAGFLTRVKASSTMATKKELYMCTVKRVIALIITEMCVWS